MPEIKPMPDTEDDKLRHELLVQATTTAAQEIGRIAAERSERLDQQREKQLVLAFNEALESACKDRHSGMSVWGLHMNPPGFPEGRRPDAALVTDPPAAVLEYKWLGDAEFSPWYAAACVLDIFSLGATVEAGLAPAAHFVVGAPREGKRGGLGQLLATLESLTPFVTRSELESFAHDWWLRWHERGDSGYESSTPPQVPEELDLRPKIVRDIPHAENDQPWRLYCVQLKPVGGRVIEAHTRYRAHTEKKKQTETETELLANAKTRLPEIGALLAGFERAEEDAVYRYYHRSLKVFWQQSAVRRARELLRDLAPEGRSLDGDFERICHEALDHEFEMSRTNTNWEAETRPILEAFWHCKYFLAQLNRYARELDEPVDMLPEGWAAALELYGLR